MSPDRAASTLGAPSIPPTRLAHGATVPTAWLALYRHNATAASRGISTGQCVYGRHAGKHADIFLHIHRIMAIE